MKNVPQHVAVIMDGNGRWARKRGLPRHAGHRAGVKAVRSIVETAAQRGIRYLTLFAFSSENWGRPKEEVSKLMGLFVEALRREVDELHKNDVKLRFIWGATPTRRWPRSKNRCRRGKDGKQRRSRIARGRRVRRQMGHRRGRA